MLIRPARASDIEQLTAMRVDLWPEGSAEEHREELVEFLVDGKQPSILSAAIFVAEDETLAGFIEVGLRSVADGCDPIRPCGYIEGWYVLPSHRQTGVGALLVQAAEEWSRAQGCTEMASDTWLDNEVSQRAHEALGYEAVDRVVTYRKGLT